MQISSKTNLLCKTRFFFGCGQNIQKTSAQSHRRKCEDVCVRACVCECARARQRMHVRNVVRVTPNQSVPPTDVQCRLMGLAGAACTCTRVAYCSTQSVGHYGTRVRMRNSLVKIVFLVAKNNFTQTSVAAYQNNLLKLGSTSGSNLVTRVGSRNTFAKVVQLCR